MSKKLTKFLILGAILIGIPLIFISLGKTQHNFKNVKHFVPEDVVIKTIEGKTVYDTIWSEIKPFSFVNQNGLVISEKDYEGHIYVADFFFTTCQTICPVMTSQMNQLILQLDGKTGKEQVKFISFTVDPEHDTVDILKQYAEKNHVNPEIWNLVTGDQRKIYELGVNSFKLSTQEDALAEGGFLHSNLFVLIDEEKHIRGYYDGTSSEEIRVLAGDIKKLISEKKHKNAKGKEL